MKDKFQTLLNNSIIPFFKENGFETKDINSETNKKLGADSYYFYKATADLNCNFYIETNYDSSDEKFEFHIDFGIYSVAFNKQIGFPIDDAPNGTGNTFSIASESLTTENTYWQGITKDTDIEALGKTLITKFETLLNAHKEIKNIDELITYYFTQKEFYCNYEFMIRYLKKTNQQSQLEKYVDRLKQQNSDGSDSSINFLKRIEECLDNRSLVEKVVGNFTKGMQVPTAWKTVLEFAEKNPHTIIGGSFEVCDNSNNLMQHILNLNDNASKVLSIIGTNSADEVFCIWQKDEIIKPIIFLGEAGRAKVIANSVEDFIALLAIGYSDVEIADYNISPEFTDDNENWKNTKFQAFYKEKFNKEIAKTGADIVIKNTMTNSDFFVWMCANDSIFKEWNT